MSDECVEDCTADMPARCRADHEIDAIDNGRSGFGGVKVSYR